MDRILFILRSWIVSLLRCVKKMFWVCGLFWKKLYKHRRIYWRKRKHWPLIMHESIWRSKQKINNTYGRTKKNRFAKRCMWQDKSLIKSLVIKCIWQFESILVRNSSRSFFMIDDIILFNQETWTRFSFY